MKKTVSPLNKKLLFAVLGVSALASVLVSAAQIYFAWNSRLQEIDVAIEEKVNASLPALNRGVWFLDEKQVKANIDVIATSPYIGRVEVSVAGRPGIFVMAGDVTKKYEFDRTWPIAGLEDKQGAEIGLIRVFGTHEAMNSALIKQAEFIIGTNLIKGMALSLVLLFIFDVLVSRHIREFMRHFYRFNLDEIEPLPRRNVKVRDEMDFLIDAINDMQATVTKSRNEERAAIAASEEAHNKTAELALKVGAAEVTTSVLHDVNNILGSLTAITMRSKRDMKVKQAEEVLTGMIEGIEMTTKTIASIIHSQQLMAMGGGERWDTVPIGLAVQDAVAMENYSLEKYKIKLVITGNQDQILVTRRHIIATVLVNLIKNARESIQAANPERREIEINAETATEGTLRLTVRDTGLGATPAVLAKIFERGFTTKEYGHGFGLAGCKYNLKNLGGDLTITSPGPGQGAIVRLTHPLDASVFAKAAEVPSVGGSTGLEDKVIGIKNVIRKG